MSIFPLTGRRLAAVLLIPIVILVIAALGGLNYALASPDVTDMTCVELNDRADVIRADNTEGPYIQPFTEWDQDDLNEMRGILDEITRRQNVAGDFCRLRTH